MPRSIPGRAAEPPLSATVLLVEDETALLDLLQLAIEGWGHRVLRAAVPAEALAHARDEARIDAALIDVGVLRAAGYDLVAALVAAQPELRPVYMSGHAARRGAGLGKDTPFLQKPFNLDDLEAALVRALQAS